MQAELAEKSQNSEIQTEKVKKLLEELTQRTNREKLVRNKNYTIYLNNHKFIPSIIHII